MRVVAWISPEYRPSPASSPAKVLPVYDRTAAYSRVIDVIRVRRVELIVDDESGIASRFATRVISSIEKDDQDSCLLFYRQENAAGIQTLNIQVAGIEPASPTWKAGIISHYTIHAYLCL